MVIKPALGLILPEDEFSIGLCEGGRIGSISHLPRKPEGQQRSVVIARIFRVHNVRSHRYRGQNRSSRIVLSGAGFTATYAPGHDVILGGLPSADLAG
ncbi:hypothetical protein NKH41_22840 [Mesorhizobium sp. M1169]|uniref:hypothetical protein n=1 Tax=Mesorhizobium sp. M1169 TaxID=2957066 RepID=UPI00333C1197